jgi:hypothetical protein
MYHTIAVGETQKVNATILPGLPGDGPAPIYFYARQPSPWREGLAVRFEQEGVTDFVGNFQCGQREYSSATVWRDAGTAICVARGFLYLVPLATPGTYKAYEGGFGSVAFSPSGETLYAIDDARVLAFGPDLSVKWKHQEDIWRYGSYVVLNRVNDGRISYQRSSILKDRGQSVCWPKRMAN